MMQEFTQLIFGGFGTIFDKKYLISNPHQAQLKNMQDAFLSNPKYSASNPLIYSSLGLNQLNSFFTDKKIVDTVKWMREHLIFTWIDCNTQDCDKIESLIHHVVRTNVLGVGKMTSSKAKDNILTVKKHSAEFNSINWDKNLHLKTWLEKINSSLYK